MNTTEMMRQIDEVLPLCLAGLYVVYVKRDTFRSFVEFNCTENRVQELKQKHKNAVAVQKG